ncbi:MAG: hypothetical protein ACXIUQ_09905 [Cecembia sp.]
MKNEDKIVDLLSEMLIRQDRFEAGLGKLADGFGKFSDVVGKLNESQERLITIQERQERVLIKILEVLEDDVPKFDELIELEQLGGKKVVLRKTK